MNLKTFLLTVILLPAAAFANPYTINYPQSSIQFAGNHAGMDFTGEFKDWTADIQFNPTNLTASTISASIQLSSATTGNAMYDGTLPTQDWFNTKAYPTATFVSESFTKTEENTYTVNGTFTLKDVSKPFDFTFALTPSSAAQTVTAIATFPINRKDFNLGQQADPKAEWVSENIQVKLSILASQNLSPMQ